MFLGIFPHENNVDGVKAGRRKGKYVSAVQVTHALDRHGQKIQTDERGNCAGVNPLGQATPPEDPEK